MEQLQGEAMNLSPITAEALHLTGNSKFLALRRIFPLFVYHDFIYKINHTEKTWEITCQWHFSLPTLTDFLPSCTITVPHKVADRLRINNITAIETFLFQIGLMEGISYWKSVCPLRYVCSLAPIPATAAASWQDWYFNGLGEFLYRNNISINPAELWTYSLTEQVEISCPLNLPDSSWHKVTSLTHFALTEPVDNGKATSDARKVLIPVGGGKDSVVTLELLREKERYAFAINPTQASRDSIALAGIDEEHCLFVQRRLDRKIVTLNQLNFWNGHTPFSGIVAFYSLFAAYLTGIPYVALSNEASSNAATVAGTEINHQYSKTAAFESSFRTYSCLYLGAAAEYFSFLRPLQEIAIARIFAHYKAYLPYFRSCNLGSKEQANKWCNNCPKCLFVSLILAVYLTPQEMRTAFGADILQNENLLPDMAGLLGVTPVKPFECVGTVEEVAYAVCKLLNRYHRTEQQLPCLLQAAATWIAAGRCSLLTFTGGEYVYAGPDLQKLQPAPFLNPEFQEILQNKMKNLEDEHE